LASYGYTNRKIVEKVDISENTVKDYMKKVFKVVGVHNRSEISPKILNWR